ncbi:hypothetical protein [Ruania zhangjianzhongii]|uniref:hypothetical protein n=1 Tax=Ruania zhangjianzhongii TaxID=2603206 RepID=UPI0011CA3D83|nr:hypothetical protein [Ruania zhangjianzhongii]
MHSRTELIAFGLIIVAIVPYIGLKALWLTGSTVGLRGTAAAAEMHSGRMMVGNNITIVLELLAVLLALAFTRPWGRRIPAWIVLGLGAGATGLLAPVVLGVPLGSLLQLAISGSVRTGGMSEMSPWAFALVYGGFGLLAVALAILGWRYVRSRWGDVLQHRPPRPPHWATAAGTIGLLPFGLAMLWWGVFGPGGTGPQGMGALAQRLPLAAAGALALLGLVSPFLAGLARWPGLAWLVVWTGCTTAALQGPTALLLANDGQIAPMVLALTLVATPGGAVYGLAVLRARRRELRTAEVAPALAGPHP